MHPHQAGAQRARRGGCGSSANDGPVTLDRGTGDRRETMSRPRGDGAGATFDPQLDRARMRVGSGDLHVLLGRSDEHVVDDVE